MLKQYYKPPLGEVSVKVWGALACFTRPEFKVERVSYPVMTPSAARGILEAILFKPEFSFAITRIEVLRPLRFVSIRRNEVQKVVDLNRAKDKWLTGEEPVEHLLADIKGRYREKKDVKKQITQSSPLLGQEENCTQRNMLALADVAYNIFAQIVLQKEKAKLQSRFGGLRLIDNIRKYQATFTRRVLKGQCYHRPSFGCRELCVQFAPVEAKVTDDAGEPLPSEALKTYGVGEVGEPLGRMLYDIVYTNDGDRLYAKFFDAVVRQGSLDTREDVLRRANRIHEREIEKGEIEP
ncbi:MAG: type I-C CRISPR-associated protein Cas5c [Acidobacteriia bacterium]|nr:type I-C CRISPR-associated protein Cas5c [Terriglobia bacterium]